MEVENLGLNNLKPLIMVVSKDTIGGNLVMMILKKHNYEVIKVETSFEALRFLKIHHQQPRRIDCLVTDIFPVLEEKILNIIPQMKADSVLAKIPTLVLSSRSLPKDQVPAIEAGASDVLAIPIEKSLLLAKVKLLVKYSQVHNRYLKLLSFFAEES